jgi:hypothetical protein
VRVADDAAADEGQRVRRAGRIAYPLIVGALILAAGAWLGSDGSLVERVATPPPIVRAVLVTLSVVAALALLREALVRLSASAPAAAGAGDAPDVRAMVRAIRFVFLAVGMTSAGAGWLIAHPLPIVVGLLVAGVDVLETSFLLLVVAARARRG